MFTPDKFFPRWNGKLKTVFLKFKLQSAGVSSVFKIFY